MLFLYDLTYIDLKAVSCLFTSQVGYVDKIVVVFPLVLYAFPYSTLLEFVSKYCLSISVVSLV